VKPLADGVGPEVLSAGLLSSVTGGSSELAGGWALRYLGSSRMLGRVAPPPPSPEERVKLAEEVADRVVTAIEAVLKGLNLSPEDWERGRKLAADALRAVAVEGWSPL
jgi:hypothetical protein